MTNVPVSKMHELETTLARRVAEMVRDSNTIEATSPQEIVVRDILPAQDLTSGDDNGWTTGGDAEWRQDWSGGGASADAWNEAYEIDSTAEADEKLFGFMGLQFDAGNPVDREVRFLKGTGGTQGVKQWVNLEEMENDTEGTGVFANFVFYGATENGSIEHWVEDALDGQRTRYLGVVGEATGEVISEPQNPLLGSGGGRGRGR